MRVDAYRRWNFTNESHQPNYIDGTMFLITVWIQLPRIIDYSEPTSKFRKQGAVSKRKTVLPGMAIPMLKIRRPNGRLIFNMEIAIRR